MKSLDFCQLNKKFDFKALSKAEKKKFYLQELFYGQAYIKKYLLVLFVLVVVGQSANSSSYLNDKQDLHHQERWIVVLTFIIATIAILISIILSFLKNAHKWIKYQIASLVIGNIATFACVFARFYGLCSRAADSIDIHMLVEGVSMSANGFYMTRFLDLLTPHWYIRIIAPSAYFIGWLISTSQIQGEPGSALFINCTFGMVNLLLVNGLHASFRWNLFANRIEKDIWNDIHRVILQKVPSPIAVFDIQGQITYANPEFNKLSENQVDVLFEKICRLKQRPQIPDREESSISVEQIFEDIDPDTPNKSKSYQYTKQCLFSEHLQNLAKLLANAIELLNEQKVDGNDYFVFDGKIPENTNNKEASFEVTLSFIIEYQKIVIILRDITDHTQLIAAETSNEYKDKLLASVSHELRTPLNGNLSLIQATLNESSVCETVKKKFLVPAYRSGKLLLHLINDILDLSQIAAKKLRLNFEEQSIRETIDSCFQLLELQAKTKGIEFKLDLPDNLPPFNTDHDRVRQIILNLLGNALKFTFQGGITLKARLIGQSQLEIEVEDTGIGIKPEDLGKLFREFTRIDDPNQITLNTKGVGLGLTIANKLAKRLGPSLTQGGITVTSAYGEGSSFKFTIMDKTKEKDISPKPLSEKPTFTQTEAFNSSLPSIDAVDQTHNHVMRKYFLDVSNLFKKQTTQEQNQSSSVEYCAFQFERAQKNILIVDDEPFNILALESFLKYSDITIDTAFNGKIAVDKVKKKLEANEHYDLIFMDCQMPIMNGLEATNLLRSMHNGNYDVPIIGCTAFNSDQTIKQCYSSGMTQVMKKPLSKLEVDKIVKMFL